MKSTKVENMREKVIALLKRSGLWRCHTIFPNCKNPPAEEIVGRDGMRHLFCLQCAERYHANHK